MSNVLKELHQEHRKTARLLGLLERQAGRLSFCTNAELMQLRQLIRYFGLYRERVHHKKEDIVFAYLQRRCPDSIELIHDLQAEHALLSDLMARFAGLLERIGSEAAVDHQMIQLEVNEFVSISRAHMTREELNLFRLAADQLDEQDWLQISREISCQVDTVKLQEIARDGGQLYEDIVAFDSLFGTESDGVLH